MELFKTLENDSHAYLMERGSKFYAYAFPVDTEADIPLKLLQVKKKHPKARHYGTAFRLQPDASVERYSDDGEPSGSAGRPILGQLVKYELTQLYLAVARYFGGTKLGIPGLIEAYKTSAQLAIQQGKIIEKKVLQVIELHLHHQDYPLFLNVCKRHDIPVIQEQFSELAILQIGLPFLTWKEQLVLFLKVWSQRDYEQIERFETELGIKVITNVSDNPLFMRFAAS